ncbi:sigma-70 family RNA polymerase sigma factor [Herbidospora galbida]|uniref:Sigma-70 family RNA polymerase sigma factor n=1 Tax=Herbidospora galbida TaxID=2575442 RepID=A0A4U3MRM1_9ACTN|nr:sigma-70 family RNA polymerase sigma factor [Herbidospora galbida]
MEPYVAIRPRLVRLAYGLLGDLAESEDVVQDAWLRLNRAEEVPEDVEGWLVVTVSRLALDVLKSARKRREEYVGPWLPEPVVDADPADRVTLDESLSLAMFVVLESLSPAERTAFVLHDVFGVPFDEIGRAVGRTPAACRQLAARARRHVQEKAPRFDVSVEDHKRVVDAFAAACAGRDIDGLLVVLDPDVVLRSDGGGLVKAALRPIEGAGKVARFLVATSKPGFRPALVNGSPGLVRDDPPAVYGLAVRQGRIVEVDIVRNPEKLRSLR